MAGSPEQFQVDIAKFVKLAGDRAQTFAREFAKSFNTMLVQNCPVVTGTLKGSWYADLNSVPQPISGPRDPGGDATIARLDVIASLMKIGDTYKLSNGAHYAVFVEFGTSHMTPRAFTRRTVNAAEVLAADALEKAKALT